MSRVLIGQAKGATSWMGQGACAKAENLDPRAFFPPDSRALSGTGVTPRQLADQAKSYCAVCPVRDQCLEYALANKIEHGIWGGATYLERRKIAKARRRKVA